MGVAQASEALTLQSDVSIPAPLLLGALIGLIGAVFALGWSIREQRRLKRAIHKSEGQFRDFAAAAADWYWEADADWRITQADGLGTRFGLDPEQFIGKTPLEIIGMDEPDEHWRAHMPTIERREPFRDFQYSMTTPDGKQHWIAASGVPFFDEKGNFQGYRGSGRDVTAEREARERFVYVMENLSEGVALWDKDDRFVICNSAYRDLAGKAAEGLAPGVTFREVVTRFAHSGESNIPAGKEDDWIAWRMDLHRAMDEPIEVKRGDRWYAASNQVLPDNSVVVRLTDITQRKSAEEKLQQAQRLETVGKLTGGVAHDFNNLLAIVLGNLDLVMDELPADHPHRELLDSAIAAAERGATLTQRLLAFSRKQTLAPREINGNELIEGMNNLLRRTLGEQTQVSIVAGDELWLCEADPSQLENALLNLAINARDAMPSGGQLTIETGNATLDEAYAARTAEVRAGQYVMIAVSDTGQGIAEDVLPHIYEPFFTTKGVGEGSGLGLSMVYGFVKQSGGHISVYSELGQGTTFKLYLPRARRCKAVHQASPVPLAATLGDREKILLVEDDSDLRAMTVRLLDGLGYRVTPAEHGVEAIAAFDSAQDFDLLLTDAVLPGPLNGCALAKELRRRDPGLKVLFMSGYAESALLNGGRMESGATLLQKPFRREDLARKVRQVLDFTGPR
ncbi:MAG: ATP-binding protein [Kiloniellales bacterium]